MIRFSLMAICFLGLVSAGTAQSTPDKVSSKQDFADIKREVETLRGTKFEHPVPVFMISTRELRAISDREMEKQYPGPKLASYSELLAWLDMVPAHTDLKAVYANYYADQVAGLYDSDTKEMCIPSASIGVTNSAKKPTEKKLQEISPDIDGIIMAHEFTHALEDQHWPLDDPKDDDEHPSADRGTAHSFVAEGSATREMIEVMPAQWGSDSPGSYFLFWNLIHSDSIEFAMNLALGHAWKGADALTEGVPDALARTEAMPYAFGYTFCNDVMRKWGLDGLDYIYEHPPISSQQVMHPAKCWEWRDFPVQIDLPETLPGDWKQISIDSMGEAGMAVVFGCQFTNLNHGLELARGWKGDHVALFKDAGGHRLLLWASAWNGADAAAEYVNACVRERQMAHQAIVTKNAGNRIEWNSPDGRNGFILRDGRRVVLLETDDRATLSSAETFAGKVVFTEPAEERTRAAVNNPLLRFNPIWASQKDGDYTVARSIGGLLSRHDRNSVGSADVFLLGMLGESRRTTSFNKWELVDGLVAKHESETRRGVTKTTLLPWGILFSREAARLPQSPSRILARTSVVWGLGGSVTKDGKVRTVHVLPFGLLFRSETSPGQSSIHILATGRYHKEVGNHTVSTTRYRLLGIPIWTTHTPVPSAVAQAF